LYVEEDLLLLQNRRVLFVILSVISCNLNFSFIHQIYKEKKRFSKTLNVKSLRKSFHFGAQKLILLFVDFQLKDFFPCKTSGEGFSLARKSEDRSLKNLIDMKKVDDQILTWNDTGLVLKFSFIINSRHSTPIYSSPASSRFNSFH